jgi:acetylornithine deacetylase/succinyl-diaminopimelate desuccinylase-like protein
MRVLLEDAARSDHLEVSFDWSGFATEPVAADTAELAPLLASAATAVGVAPPSVGPSTGTSDLRHFVSAGIPCLLYGPGRGFNPHRPNEHFLLEDLPTMVRLYVGLMRSWCGDGV